MPSLRRSSPPHSTKPQRSSGSIRSTRATCSSRRRAPATLPAPTAPVNVGVSQFNLTCSNESSMKPGSTAPAHSLSTSSANPYSISESWTLLHTSNKVILEIPYSSLQTVPIWKALQKIAGCLKSPRYCGLGGRRLSSAKYLKISSGSGVSLGCDSSRRLPRRKPGRSGHHGQT